MSPFEIVEKGRRGERAFVALWLVDPHRRVLSTANVPPLRRDWMEGCLGEGGAEGVEEKVRKRFGLGEGVRPMAVEEAREHRRKLMEERSISREVETQVWEETSYGFCEH